MKQIKTRKKQKKEEKKMKKLAIALLTMGTLSISKSIKKPLQDDRNEISIKWHNDKGERKVFKIDDIEKDDGQEKIHSKTLLQKYVRTSFSPCEGGEGNFLGSSSSCNTGNCFSSSNCNNNNYGNYNYGGDDYGAGCASGYGAYGNGYGYSSGSGCGNAYGNIGNEYAEGNAFFGNNNNAGGFAYGNGFGYDAYGNSLENNNLGGFANNYQGSLLGDRSCGSGVIGTRNYNGNGYYDGSASGKNNNLSYQQLCNLANLNKADQLQRQNARNFLRKNNASKDNKNFATANQINNILKENERDCLIDACDSAKIANGDIRNQNLSANQENSRENEIKRIHDIVNCADRKNEHLNMNEKAKDNLHSHKRVVTEFDKLEHFKKSSENCKDAEKGRRANVDKANDINKNQRRHKGDRSKNFKCEGKSNLDQLKDKNELNYKDADSSIANRKYLKNNALCNSDNGSTNANSDTASCNSDANGACSYSCGDENCFKYGRQNELVDYDNCCDSSDYKGRYGRNVDDRENRNAEYPVIEGGCDYDCGYGYGDAYGKRKGKGSSCRTGCGKGKGKEYCEDDGFY